MNKLFKKIGNIVLMGLLAVSLTGGMLYSIERKSTAEAAFYPVQTKSVRLYSGISSVSTSARLRSFYDLSGSTKLTMSMFGSVGYVTFDPGTPKEESASFTGITDNGDGTQTLTGLTRGLLGRYPFGTGGVAYSHDANSYVVASNGADFYSKFAFKENNESVTGIWNFNTVLPVSSLIATTSTQFVTKALLDGTIAAGVATSSEANFGGVWLGTALQQASSTNGGANQPFVMQTRYATDTPTSGCAAGYTGTAGAGCSVIATLTGKIKQTFLDIFSTVNTWTGANTFTATSTVATTTHSGVALGIKPGDNTMLGAEAITAGNAVSSYFYQSDGGVQYDTSILNSGTANSFSQNITVGNNANRMIVVSIMIGQDTINTPQVGGQNMKLINSRALTATGYLNSYYYIAPSTGVQTVSGSFSGGAIPYSVSIFSFYNVNQTVQYNASSTSSVADSSTGSISITPPQGGTLLFGYFGSRDPSNCTTPSALVGANNNLLSLDGLNICSLAGYSYIDPSASLQTVSFSGATHNGGALGIFTIPPATSPSYGYLAKASAQNGPSYSTPLATSTRVNFLGFALTSSGSLGTSTIQTEGIVTGLSGLLPNKTYFLSDTPGAISTTPGTIRRVIGTAITTTSLLITNSPTW